MACAHICWAFALYHGYVEFVFPVTWYVIIEFHGTVHKSYQTGRLRGLACEAKNADRICVTFHVKTKHNVAKTIFLVKTTITAFNLTTPGGLAHIIFEI